MQKLLIYLSVLTLAICLGGCGSSTATTASTTKYDSPASLAPANLQMGGAVQGGTLSAKFANYSVSTVAGSAGFAGFSNYSTTNGPPALFNHPTDITTNGSSYYVADYGNNAIRQIDPLTGAVTTLQCTDAVSGLPVFFNRPTSLTVKSDGTQLYIVDSGSNTIRIIEIATKKVTTIGSTEGLAGSVDVAVILPATTADATLARFNQPTGITTDGENLYVSDTGNHTVRWINLATNAVSTLAGSPGTVGSADGIMSLDKTTSTARFNQPARITTNGTTLFLTDFQNRTIRTIDILTGEVKTLAGTPGALGSDNGSTDALGIAARFNQPNGITTDGTNLYVTDSYNNTLRKVIIGTGAVSTMPIPTGSLHTPVGITTDGKSLFIADTSILNTDNTYTYSNSIIGIK